ncbi:ribosomal acidic phosphoprotein P2 [Heterostelium album PN500]|uniref:Ribosomal acidic phosphoprotein P2 n=1 Tax=Heterostelium pallidum (strain ATCC 26659 / Pp 5 / PN500) TaxID=670386 RepID=D3BRR6_HETP5|nr:ribosomal acidic phosphoprotein P2 [Heterostelium album PN500]EFA76098.1 ribosomal acidic phosphoprotein P2 [Heterostelium album PN500]|eukprot:XP_020428232.1 ribosomal acidic phosphoprotein P2 [Heterostelium album PN500]
MKYLSAYLLVVLGGNATPSAADVTKVLSSVGAEVDATRVAAVVAELNGKNITELIASGMTKVGSAPAAGAAAPAAAATTSAAPAAAAAAPKKEEKKEESDEDMGMGLFD